MHANACAESEHTGFRQPLPLDFGRYVVGRGRLVTVALQLGRYQWLAVTSACRGSNGRSKPLRPARGKFGSAGQTGQIHTGFLGFSGVVTGEGFERGRAAGGHALLI